MAPSRDNPSGERRGRRGSTGRGRSGQGNQAGSGRSGSDRSSSGRAGSGKSGSGKSRSGQGSQAGGRSKGRGAGGQGGGSFRKRTGAGRSTSSSGKQAGDRGGRRDQAEARESVGDKKARARRDLKGPAAMLPHWVIEALSRVTPAARVRPALEALGEATLAFEEGRFKRALREARRAKDLAPADPTVREVLGLAAYRAGDWNTALRELRAYRRMSGDASHLPIEMDVLRALQRDREVDEVWELLQRADVPGRVKKEGAVVYGSVLLERKQPQEALDLTAPKRMPDKVYDEDMKLWFVAARAAAALGDAERARRLRNAILAEDPAFPGMDQLEAEIARSST